MTDISKWKKSQLLDLCNERGIECDDSMTRANILKQIKATMPAKSRKRNKSGDYTKDLRSRCRQARIKQCIGSQYVSKAQLKNLLERYEAGASSIVYGSPRKSRATKSGTVADLRSRCRKMGIPECKGKDYVSKSRLQQLLKLSPSPKVKKVKSSKRKSEKERYGKPKRPMSAYILFTNEHRDSMRRKYPDEKMTDITKRLADKWNNMSDSEKEKYVAQASREKSRYQSAKRVYMEGRAMGRELNIPVMRRPSSRSPTFRPVVRTSPIMRRLEIESSY